MPKNAGGLDSVARIVVGLALTCTMFCPAPSRAEQWFDQQSRCAPEDGLQWCGGTLRLENDLFAGTDSNYTNGLALSLVSHDMEGRLDPGWGSDLIGNYGLRLGNIETAASTGG
ncbi:lipid A-modifier LpxR family protein [Marinobacter sp.]|uniref:lipid A-modifier LpxR family protein n=1 Tax=Marinobacter sp. TaxID=50741 RepID=UPI003A929476